MRLPNKGFWVLRAPLGYICRIRERGPLHLLRSVSQVVYLGLSAIEEGSPQTQTGACGLVGIGGKGCFVRMGLLPLVLL